ncbi:DinB family protein [Parafrigoribacterium mesophilum]
MGVSPGDSVSDMDGTDPKADLQRYLEAAREALLWKLDGLSEYDVRRPLTPTGTNLLGLIKHLAGCELGYFGEVFHRPFDEPLPWSQNDAEPNVDMWARADESREHITRLYRRACAHSDITIRTLPLDAIGGVPWWPTDRSKVTLHQILIHMIAETHRHAGHADIVRELIDGAAGLRKGNENLPSVDRDWWDDYRRMLERVAREAG